MSCVRIVWPVRKANQRRTSSRGKTQGEGVSPIDVIGRVICFGLKWPRDRLGNRGMINFIDHRTNYCPVFLAKSKDVAATKLKHLMAFLERRFKYRIHVLRTGEGGEYKTLELFCKGTGNERQVSEPRNQASKGKAERMHHTIMNTVRSMIFGSGFPLKFWINAAEYAAYILNRSPTKANAGFEVTVANTDKVCPRSGRHSGLWFALHSAR